MLLRTAAAFLAIATLGADASFSKIAGYEPTSSVTDQNALDLDQKALEAALGEDQQSSYDNAMKVYTMGGNSMSYAAVTVSALPADVMDGTPIEGTAMDGNKIEGKAMGDHRQGDTTVNFLYPVSEVQENHVKCKVGGLPTADQMTDGCLTETGNLMIADTAYAYTAVSNMNARTIQTLSTTSKMFQGDAEYDKYETYYGTDTYADKWVMAGLKGEEVAYSTGKSFDFSKYGFSGRKEVIKKGTAYMNVYMSVIGHMYRTVEYCTDVPKAGPYWDAAVAFYAGSLEGTTGMNEGSKFLHELADKRCQNFGTCGEEGNMKEGLASVNSAIMGQFDKGKEALVGGDCGELSTVVDTIIAHLGIPLVQGTLRYAWRVAYEEDNLEKKNAEGVIFAAAVLPRVSACKPEAADTILENMNVAGEGEYSKEFPAVKEAFESVYECMGITCAQVGGLLASDGSYNDKASPCEDPETPDESPASYKTETVALATTLGAIAAHFL